MNSNKTDCGALSPIVFYYDEIKGHGVSVSPSGSAVPPDRTRETDPIPGIRLL